MQPFQKLVLLIKLPTKNVTNIYFFCDKWTILLYASTTKSVCITPTPSQTHRSISDRSLLRPGDGSAYRMDHPIGVAR